MKRALASFLLVMALAAAGTGFAAEAQQVAIVVGDQTALRPAPRDSAKPNALLWQGETLEIRGERLDYLQVYDHRIERGGFVSAKSVRRMSVEPANAPELLAVIRFLRDTAGSEALGIGYAALYIQAARVESLRGPEGAEALDALGSFAERLARRASSGAATTKSAQAALGGHLEVAMHYGVGFTSFERDSRMVICYDGDAFRRVIELGHGDALQRVHAVLGLTRTDCADPDLQPTERRAADEARAQLLEAIDVSDVPPYLRNRVHMRRAAIWNSVAFHSARRGEPAQPAAARALQELASVDKHELTDDDQRVYADAAMRVNASRWAALPAKPAVPATRSGRPHLLMAKGQPGETCVLLVDAKHEAGNELAKRCTYGIVWEESATLNREGNALAVAVQASEAWREMWVFRKSGKSWSVASLPPAATNPGVGYAEFAGWIPGGKQVLVAREASGEGKYRRSYELMRIDTLSTINAVPDPQLLPAFQRWQDAGWKETSLSLR